MIADEPRARRVRVILESRTPGGAYTRGVRTRTLGRTGLEISELVLGGGNVGGLLIRADDETRREAIRRVVAAGITWIDTAPSYGAGASESALGWLLAERPEPLQISTKVRVDVSRGDLAGQVERSLESSLERLGRDRVELVQLHNRIMPRAGRASVGLDELLGRGGVADALDAVVERGLARFRGITAVGDAFSCRRAVESGRFDTAQVYYNLLNPSAGRSVPGAFTGYDMDRLIDVCKRADVGVLCIRVLAAGVIATDERHGRESPLVPNAEVEVDAKRAAAVFDRLGSSCGSRAQTAIRYVLSNPDVSCAVVGIAELDQLDEAIAGARTGPLPDAALRTLDALYASDFGTS
jgi:D-threo-aldose 1-dehydrogenase